MKIKKKTKTKKLNSFFEIFFKLYFIITIVLTIPIIVLFFNTGYWSSYKDQIFDRLYTSEVINYIRLPEILLLKVQSKFYKIPHLNLNITFKDQLNLENQRINALESFNKIGRSRSFKEVSSTIDFNNFTFKTNLRLKGDRTSHYFEKKNSSYKIDLKGENRILGMEKFSLQKPRIRNYAHEWIFHELLGELDLIKLNYIFLDLSINGSDPSLYVLEESFDKILVERNKKRNGPIFSLFEEFSQDIKKTELQFYNKKFWLKNDNFNIVDSAQKKLESFLYSNTTSTDIFDADKWAKFFAITDLNYYEHARGVKSVKFFYNPVSGLFEPIGFDAHRRVPNYSSHISNWGKLPIKNSFENALICKKNLTKCINNEPTQDGYGDYFLYKFFYNDEGKLNKKFFKKYQKYIFKVTSKDFLDKFFEERKIALNKINSLIYDDFFFVDHNYFYGPGLYYFSKDDIYLRANNLLDYFSNNIDKIFVKQNNDQIIIRNILRNNLSVKIKLIECQNSLSRENYSFLIDKNIENKIINLDYKNYKDLKCSKLILEDSNKKIFNKVIYPTTDKKVLKLDDNTKNLFKKYFIIKNNEIFLKENKTKITENILIPKNYIVKILPGQSIYLTNHAFIFSNSAWYANGLDEKIFISGKKNDFGGGLLINDKSKKSLFKNVEFSNLNGPNINYEQLTNLPLKEFISNFIIYGSVNFFNTNVFLNNVNFRNICSEDALNIVSSKFLLNNISFEENCSDSIDIDFGEGKITNAKFKNIDNDAIDFSGSKVELKNIYLENIGDKLVSSGENSVISINGIIGNNSFIGIASKDGSLTNLENAELNNTKIALASYVKKKEYGPGKIIAKKTLINNSIKDSLSDATSEIFLNLEKKKIKSNKILKIIYDRNETLLNNINN